MKPASASQHALRGLPEGSGDHDERRTVSRGVECDVRISPARGDERLREGSAAGNRVLAIISQSRDGVHKVTPGLAVPQIGHLFSLNRATGRPTDVSDVGDQEYAWAGEHKDLWKEFPTRTPPVCS